MSNQLKDALQNAGVSVPLVEKTEGVATFNVMNVFTGSELESLGQLLRKKYKTAEIEAIEKVAPTANEAELYILLDMREAAARQVIARQWDDNSKRWKNLACSAARLLGRDDSAQKIGKTQLVELRDAVHSTKIPELIKAIIVDLDKGSKDERVILAEKLLLNKMPALG